jgi:hypothetical protein
VKHSLTIRVEKVDLEKWVQKAAEDRVGLSEWMRRELNASANGQNVLLAPGVRVAGGEGRAESGVSGIAIEQPAPGYGETVLGAEVPEEVKSVRHKTSEDSAFESMSVRDRVIFSRCDHGKRRGDLCYKCDPKMGFPKVKSA